MTVVTEWVSFKGEEQVHCVRQLLNWMGQEETLGIVSLHIGTDPSRPLSVLEVRYLREIDLGTAQQ